MSKHAKKVLHDIIIEIFGSFLIGIAVYNFALNAKFPMTGFSGISLILYRLFNLPIGFTTVLLNIPVALLCYKLLGKGFFLRSLRCMVISSIIIDFVCPLLPVYEGDRLLSTICTGVIGGIGYAIIYMRNSSTGGSDFIIMAAKSLKPHLSVGKIAFLSDIGIILIGGLIFKDVDGIIYGMIINYIFALVVDKLMYGINAGKLALIVTTKGKEVIAVIDQKLERGATLIDAYGGYQFEHKDIVLCACSNKEMFLMEQEIKEVDNNAFTIILESNEVLGEGFKNLKIAQSKTKISKKND